MKYRLKPCPFCDYKLVYAGVNMSPCKYYDYFSGQRCAVGINCKKCGAKSKAFGMKCNAHPWSSDDTEDEAYAKAVEAWNRRTQEEATK